MTNGEKEIIEAAGLIANARHLLAFTGAGISVESGIPPFRGEDGIWSRYDPSSLDIESFSADPSASWEVISKIFYEFLLDAKPNPAHHLLARLERKGLLRAVITQNIDDMHREAGSRQVIEYHGNSKWLICNQCGERYRVSDISLHPLPPRCAADHSILKPDFVFFGEGIPPEAASRAVEEASMCDVMMIVGTTGEVMPAGMIPSIAKAGGAKIIEINPERSAFTRSVTDLFLQGRAGEISRQLDAYLF